MNMIEQSHSSKSANMQNNPVQVALADLEKLETRTGDQHFGQSYAPQNMKTKTLLVLAMTIFAVAITTGCNRALVLKTPLEPGEKVASGDTVFVDGVAAGHVRNVVTEGGQRLAVLAIKDEAGARQKMRAGVVRLIQGGQIDLHTDGVAADAPPLPPGSLIPAKAKAAFVIGKIANKQIGLVILLAVVGIALLVILFRSAKGTVVVLLALLLAAATGWVLHPYAVPWVEKLYQSAPTDDKSGASQKDQAPDHKAAGQGVARVERHAVEILNRRPAARLVAFAAVSVTGFLIYTLLISRALCATKRNAC